MFASQCNSVFCLFVVVGDAAAAAAAVVVSF